MGNGLENYLKAGKILTEVKAEIFRRVKPGEKILDVAEFVEKKILEPLLAFRLHSSLGGELCLVRE